MIRLYTDAGLLSPNPSPKGGVYGFVIIDDDDNILMEKSGVIDAKTLGHDGYCSSNVAELYALCYGVLSLPVGSHAGIYCDNEVAVGRVFLAQKRAGVPPWLSEMVDNARLRLQNLSKFEYAFTGGHPTKAELEKGETMSRYGKDGQLYRKAGLHVSKWNCHADNLCKIEADKWREANRKETE